MCSNENQRRKSGTPSRHGRSCCRCCCCFFSLASPLWAVRDLRVAFRATTQVLRERRDRLPSHASHGLWILLKGSRSPAPRAPEGQSSPREPSEEGGKPARIPRPSAVRGGGKPKKISHPQGQKRNRSKPPTSRERQKVKKRKNTKTKVSRAIVPERLLCTPPSSSELGTFGRARGLLLLPPSRAQAFMCVSVRVCGAGARLPYE